MPIHNHCKKVAWSAESKKLNEKGLFDVIVASVLPPLLPVLPADSCKYELSDINEIAITYEFTNKTLLTSYDTGISVIAAYFGDPKGVNGNSVVPLVPQTGENPAFLTFVNNAAMSFKFVPHDNLTGGNVGGEPPTGEGVPFEFIYPPLHLGVALLSPFPVSCVEATGQPRCDPVVITGGSVVIKGHHYYIPTPGTFPLIGLGLAALGYIRRNRKQF